MTLRSFALLIAAFAVGALSPARADIGVAVKIDTSTVNGLNGFLDFQFGGGVSSQAATAVISNFASDGVLGVPTLTGNASGTLPGDVTLTNSGFPPDDYYTPFLFGNLIAFHLTFGGPAVSSPDGVSDASTFAFSILDSTGASPLLLPLPLPPENPGGFGFLIDLNNDGSLGVTNFMPAANVVVPEPGSVILLATALAGLLTARRRR